LDEFASQIRNPKLQIGLRELRQSNLRFRNFGFEMQDSSNLRGGNSTYATHNPVAIHLKPSAPCTCSNSSLVSDQLQTRHVSSGFPFVRSDNRYFDPRGRHIRVRRFADAQVAARPLLRCRFCEKRSAIQRSTGTRWTTRPGGSNGEASGSSQQLTKFLAMISPEHTRNSM